MSVWVDRLERMARHCRGCGEWSFTDLCDWCFADEQSDAA